MNANSPTVEDAPPLSADELKQLIALLKRVRFPVLPDLFQALCAAVSTTALELVIFTPEGKVFLLPRPEDDPWFADQVHGPGTVILPIDLSKQAILNRLMRKEIGGKKGLTRPQLIDWFVFPRGSGEHENPRGHEVGILLGAVYTGTKIPNGVTLGDPEDLPENLIVFHRDLIATAYEWFKGLNV
jgi:hypothetical protein